MSESFQFAVFFAFRSTPELNHFWVEVVLFGIGLVVFVKAFMRKKRDEEGPIYSTWFYLIWSTIWMLWTAYDIYRLHSLKGFYDLSFQPVY
jgi:hypothetical protein